MYNKLLSFEIDQSANYISKKYTLGELLKLFVRHEITPKGSLKTTSKKNLLTKSLRLADENSVTKFLSEAKGQIKNDQSQIRDSSNPLNLHPEFIQTKVEIFYNNKNYEEAVRVAFMRINNRIKKHTGLELDGAPLMRSAFSKQSPLIKLNSLSTQEEKDEQEGMMHILEGGMLAFRNPHSHDDERKMTREDATKIIELTNYLMSMLDKCL